MKKNLRTTFNTRQHMLSKDFELYYYSDTSLSGVASHMHDYYEFYFFLEGDVSMQIGNKLFPVTYGDIMLIPPGVYHKAIIHSTQTPYSRFVFWISREYCRHLLDISPNYGFIMQYVETHKEYIFHNDRIPFNMPQSMLIRLTEEIKGNRFGRDAQISLSVNGLILYLNRMLYERIHPKTYEALSIYQHVSLFIEEHLDEDLSLDRLAREFYVSKYYIAHTFKDNTGLSIHQYITKKRLEACQAAILSNTNINEAYHQCGFSDYSSFFRAFKKEYGISPKEYRDLFVSIDAPVNGSPTDNDKL